MTPSGRQWWAPAAAGTVLAVVAAGALAGAGLGGGRAADREAVPAHADRGGAAAAAHPPARHPDAGTLLRARAAAGPVRPAPGARALVVPHHWLAGHLIVAGLRDVAAGRTVRRVVLIGPNHIGAGGVPVATSDLPWTTVAGRVEADAGAVELLTEAGVARLAPPVLTSEHALSGLMPVVAAELPGARVVPLAVRPGMRAAEAEALARALVPLLDEGTVLVASVDFSHGLDAGTARANDAESLAALVALDDATVLGWSAEHVDSPGSLATVMAAMRSIGATTFELRAHSTSADLNGSSGAAVTSYLSGVYR